MVVVESVEGSVGRLGWAWRGPDVEVASAGGGEVEDWEGAAAAAEVSGAEVSGVEETVGASAPVGGALASLIVAVVSCTRLYRCIYIDIYIYIYMYVYYYVNKQWLPDGSVDNRGIEKAKNELHEQYSLEGFKQD